MGNTKPQGTAERTKTMNILILQGLRWRNRRVSWHHQLLGMEDTGIVTAKIDAQKTEATREKILEGR